MFFKHGSTACATQLLRPGFWFGLTGWLLGISAIVSMLGKAFTNYAFTTDQGTAFISAIQTAN